MTSSSPFAGTADSYLRYRPAYPENFWQRCDRARRRAAAACWSTSHAVGFDIDREHSIEMARHRIHGRCDMICEGSMEPISVTEERWWRRRHEFEFA